MAEEPVKILLVDDHPLFRRGLRFLLSQEYCFDVVAEATDGLEGVKLARYHKPDIVLLDLDMPLMSGAEALAQMLDNRPDLPVLILTVSENAENLQKCLNLGARGYILKNADTDFLVGAIRAAMSGSTTVSDEMLQKQQRQTAQRQKTQTALEALTAREKEVLQYIAAGMGNKMIADEMKVSENTVKVHVQNILKKLGLHSRVQAAVFSGTLQQDDFQES
ncbi:MAG: response regulator transcription factor [Neisseria sp.]|nr:response regulator transcription factor [Neisseria sp.]